MLRRLKIILDPTTKRPILQDLPKQTQNTNSQDGQSLIEYLVIVALVAVGGIGIMRTLGQSVNVAFGRVAKSLGADVEGSIASAKVGANDLKKRNLRNFMTGANSGTDTGEVGNP